MLSEFNPDKIFEEMTEELWNYVFNRDNELCQICGKPGEEEHHIKFKSHGGKNFANNLILLCISCHKNRQHGINRIPIRDLLEKVLLNENNFRSNLV